MKKNITLRMRGSDIRFIVWVVELTSERSVKNARQRYTRVGQDYELPRILEK